MIRVLVVDDSFTVRQCLIEMLSRDPEIEVVGEAGNGQHAIELVAELRPDVVTLDIVMPELTGLQATEHIIYPRVIGMVADGRLTWDEGRARLDGGLLETPLVENFSASQAPAHS